MNLHKRYFTNFTTLRIISFILIALLGYYILQFKEGFYLPEIIFWLCLVGIFSSILYQITFFNKKKDYVELSLILMQIFLTALLIRLLFISPEDVLIGYDSYNEYVTLARFNDIGVWDPSKIGIQGSYYPILYLFCIAFAKLTGISIFYTAKWILLTIFFIPALGIYLIGSLKYNKKAGLIAALCYSFVYISLFFHSSLQRETLAIPLFVLIIYLYLRSVNSENDLNVIFLVLSMFLASILVLTHHLTSFLLLIFFMIFLFLRIFGEKFQNRINIKIDRISMTYVALLFTLIFAYWAYLKITPLEVLTRVFEESAITGINSGVSLPNTLRYYILYRSEMIFTAIFGAISLLGIIILGKKRKISDITFLMFGGVIALLMFITILGGLLKTQGMGLGSRFQTFVYMAFFILVGYVYSQIYSKQTFNYNIGKKLNKVIKCIIPTLKKILPILIILFLILNIYRIEPALYSDYHYVDGDSRSFVSSQELNAVTWLGLSRGFVIHDTSLNGVFNLLKYPPIQNSSYGVKPTKNQPFNTVIHSKIMPFKTQNLTIDNLVYNDGDASIYIVKNINQTT